MNFRVVLTDLPTQIYKKINKKHGYKMPHFPVKS